MAAPKLKFKRDDVIQSIIKCDGAIYLIALDLGCVESTVHKHIADMKLRDIVESVRYSMHKRMIDKAETALMEALDAKKNWAVTFVLQRLAKDTYSEKQLIEQTITESKVIKPKKGKPKK